MNTLLGKKLNQSERFLSDGRRIPVTVIDTSGNSVVFIKNKDKHGYWAVQLGIGTQKKSSKSQLGHIKGAQLEKAPRFLKEVKISDEEASNLPILGTKISPSDVFQPGDIIDVSGVSKGKGFAGVVKRHHFKGGPRTHGQSDRERAPGSIGQTTTPGRVYRGKRMAGRMGNQNVTVKNLKIVGVSDTTLLVQGLVPGFINSFIVITKQGVDKKFVPLYETPQKQTAQEVNVDGEKKEEENATN